MNELNFITPDWNAPNAVKAFVTTRMGGASESQFKSLNLAQHVGDAAAAVDALGGGEDGADRLRFPA